MKFAVVVIDMLEDFFKSPPLSEKREGLTRATNTLVQQARQSGGMVVWIRQEFEPDLSDAYLSMKDHNTHITIRGTKGCQILRELDVANEDSVLIKKRYSAFYQTDLTKLLEVASIEHLVLTGVNTHACVRATAVDAYQQDFRVSLATDAVDSYDEQYHRESLRYLEQSIARLTSTETLIQNHFAWHD